MKSSDVSKGNQQLEDLRVNLMKAEAPAFEIPVGGAAASGLILEINAPLVNIEGSADEATARLASELVLKELSRLVGV